MRVSYNIPARTTTELKTLTSYLETSQKDALDALIQVADAIKLGDDRWKPYLSNPSNSNDSKPKSFVVSYKFGQWMEINSKKLGISKSELFLIIVEFSHVGIIEMGQTRYQKALDLLWNGLEAIETLQADVRKVCPDDSLDLTLEGSRYYLDLAIDGLKTAIREIKPYREPS